MLQVGRRGGQADVQELQPKDSSCAAIAMTLPFPSIQVCYFLSQKQKVQKYESVSSEGTSSSGLICILPSFRSNT